MVHARVFMAVLAAAFFTLPFLLAGAAVPTQGHESSTLSTGTKPDQPAGVSETTPGVPSSSVKIGPGMDPAEARRRFAEAQVAFLDDVGKLPKVGRVKVVIIGPSVLRAYPTLLTALGQWHPDLGFYVALDAVDPATRPPMEAAEDLRVQNNIRSYPEASALVRSLGGWRVAETTYLGTPAEAAAVRAVAGRVGVRQVTCDGLAAVFQQLLASVRQRAVERLSADDLQRAQLLAQLAERL